jgi:hypothetical protein
MPLPHQIVFLDTVNNMLVGYDGIQQGPEAIDAPSPANAIGRVGDLLDHCPLQLGTLPRTLASSQKV